MSRKVPVTVYPDGFDDDKRREMRVYAIRVLGRKDLWNIVNDYGARFEMFEGTPKTVKTRAEELQSLRRAGKI